MSYLASRPDYKFQGQNITNYEDRQGQPVYAIVQHRMGRDAKGNLATMAGTKSWFENKASKVSAHFGISLAGEIWQFVPLTQAAWANGIIEDPDMGLAWLKEAVEKKLNPNWRTVSIENEGDSDTVMPEAQYQANKSLTAWLLQLHVLRASSQTIVRHSQITARQRANCPGVGFPMVRLLKELSMSNDFIDPITNIPVIGPMADFYQQKGGVAIFGRPITPGQPANSIPGKTFGQAKTIQWFERARFELQPDNTVFLGLVGREAWNGLI